MKRLLIILILVCTIPVIGYGYSDVPENMWYESAALELNNLGYMVGDNEGNFNPELSISRREFSTVLLRQHSLIMVEDIYTNSKYLSELYGIIEDNKYTDGEWDLPITRLEAAEMMHNFTLSSEVNLVEINVDFHPSELIKDYNTVEEGKRQYVDWCVKYGVMVGDDLNNFRANSELNRAEAAVILYRMIDPNTVSKVDYQDFTKLLSSYSTYTTNDSNRNFNVNKAAESINGTILQPGEQFSYYKTIGNPGKNAGYKASSVISGGKYVKGYGGGVCQDATTLFNAVLRANLQIDERRAHSLKTSYVDPGYDATFASGSIDFKFTNNYDTPILINATFDYDTRELKIEIYGDRDLIIPDIKLYTTGKGNSWTLYREVNGEVNYKTSSYYKG